MTARATIKQSDLNRMASVANTHNVTIEVENEFGKVRVMPNIPAIQQAPAIDSEIDPEMTSLQAWREKHGSKNGRDTRS